MSSSTRAIGVDCSGISQTVTVHGLPEPNRNREHAATWLELGYHVTDAEGFELMVETLPGGSRRVVRGSRGEVLLQVFNHNNQQDTRERAREHGTTGRPSGLPDRVLTDYEAGQSLPATV